MDWAGPTEYNGARAGGELHQIPPRDSRDAPLQRRIPFLFSTAPNYQMEVVAGQDENENRFHLNRVLETQPETQKAQDFMCFLCSALCLLCSFSVRCLVSPGCSCWPHRFLSGRLISQIY